MSLQSLCEKWDGKTVWALIDKEEGIWRQAYVISVCPPLSQRLQDDWEFVLYTRHDSWRHLMRATPADRKGDFTKGPNFESIYVDESIEIPADMLSAALLSPISLLSNLISWESQEAKVNPLNEMKRLQLELVKGRDNEKRLEADLAAMTRKLGTTDSMKSRKELGDSREISDLKSTISQLHTSINNFTENDKDAAVITPATQESAEIFRLKESIGQLQDQLNQMLMVKEKVEKLGSSANARALEMSALETELERLQFDIINLQDQKVVKNMVPSERKILDLKNQINDLHNQLEQGQLEALNDIIESTSSKNIKLEATIDALHEKIKRLESTLDKNIDLEATINVLHKEINRLEEELLLIRKRRESFEKEKSMFLSKYVEKENLAAINVNEEEANRLQAFENKNVELEATIEDLQKEINALEVEGSTQFQAAEILKAAENKNVELEAIIDDLQKEVDALQKEGLNHQAAEISDATENKNVELEATINDLQKEVNELQKEVDRLRVDEAISPRDSDIILSRQNFLYKAEIVSLAENFAIFEDGLRAANKDKKALQSQINKLRIKGDAQQKEITAETEGLEEMEKRYKNEIAAFKVEKAEMLKLLTAGPGDILDREGYDVRNTQLLFVIEELNERNNSLEIAEDHNRQTFELLHSELDEGANVMKSQSEEIKKLKEAAADQGTGLDLKEWRGLLDALEVNVCTYERSAGIPVSPTSASASQNFSQEIRDDWYMDELGVDRESQKDKEEYFKERARLATMIGARASALKERLVVLEEKRVADQIHLEKTNATRARAGYPTEKLLQGSLGIGSFALFRKGDVNSMTLQIEHLKVELFNKSEEVKKMTTEKVSSDVMALKCFVNVLEKEVLSVVKENMELKERLEEFQNQLAVNAVIDSSDRLWFM